MVDLPEIQYAIDPESLIAPDLADSEYPASLELLRKLKPAEDGMTGRTVDGKPVIKFHGLVASLPDPEEEPEYQEYAFDLWQTLKVGDKELRPSTRMLVPAKSLVSQTDGRGGEFATWLVDELMKTTTNGNRSLAWQASPPPLYQEGIKVQTPWLFKFLRDPMQLRHTTVLRMPQFNMSEAEAQSLANYFAAVDHTDYPYQQITQRNTPYLEHRAKVSDLPGPEAYLDESWKVLNAPLCIKCHSVGGRQVTVSDPKTDIRGPNLDLTVDRLRPDWLMLWLYKPQWVTPYTSMPQPLPRGKVAFPEVFGGDPETQTISLRDALMNYHRLMESQGKFVYQPAAPAGNAGQGGE